MGSVPADTAVGSGRTVILFGASGQIGSAVQRSIELCPSRSGPVVAFRWEDIVSGDGLHLRSEFLAGLAQTIRSQPCVDLVFANGITDPNDSPDRILFSNCEFPSLIARCTSAIAGPRFLSVGTVFEVVAGHAEVNPYTRSKLLLSERMAELAHEPGHRGRFLHVRLHTVYGGPPKRYMFLGRIAHALCTSSEFPMTAGEQLREYHHAEDVACSLLNLLGTDWSFGPSVEINSGLPVRLADLATSVFRHYGRLDLLKIGALARPAVENFDRTFPRSPSWLLPCYRDPILGVINVLKPVVNRSVRG